MTVDTADLADRLYRLGSYAPPGLAEYEARLRAMTPEELRAEKRRIRKRHPKQRAMKRAFKGIA
jgi:hypothetical protein